MSEKIIVALVVYNRFENLKRWLECWDQSDQANATLVVIHNYEPDKDRKPYEKLCKRHSNVKYIPRDNIGFDIGAFQDVCRERLSGFDNDWNYLFWITDDTIIMRKDLLNVFINPLRTDAKIGLVCNEISKEKVIHARTSGFAIRKETSLKIQFPIDPIQTKNQCYYFEHAGRNQTLHNQIQLMGMRVFMPLPLVQSAVWDTGHRLKQNRYAEHHRVFPRKFKITFICPIYNSFPEIISSLICQTHENWELLLIHDGPNDTGLNELVNNYGDQRISYYETEERGDNWGHHLRQAALQGIKNGSLAPDTDYIVITNADNYHVPVYCEYMLNGFLKNSNAVATYCAKMVHSYKAWDVIDCRFQRGFIDCAGVMIKKEVACDVGWNDITSHSSDFTYFSDIAKKYGQSNFIKVTGCLLIHN